MIAVYFFYGLSFFSLGLVIAVYPKDNNTSWLARNIKLIAVFGLVHGVNEWLEMLELTGSSIDAEPLATVLAALSFFCLLWFGTSYLVRHGASRLTYAFAFLLFTAWVSLAVLFRSSPVTSNVSARYLLCIPGTALTAVALWQSSKTEGMLYSRRLLRISAVAFAMYGVAAGIFGPEARFFPASIINGRVFQTLTGIPIQLVRAAIAILIAGTMTGALQIFDAGLRGRLRTEVAARTRELQEANDSLKKEIEDRIERSIALEESEARYHDLFENAYDAIFIIDSELNYVDVNKRAIEIFGYDRAEFLTMNIVDLLPKTQLPTSRAEFNKLKERQPYERFVGKAITKSGRVVDVEVSSSPIVEDGRVTGSRDVVRDITDRTHLEEQLRQAQKMEAVGQLAGGIAHDFNNMLTAILGYAALMQGSIDENDQLNEWIRAIVAAVDNAAALTKNLLTFSRKQLLNMHPVDLNGVLDSVRQLLRRSIGEDIQINISAADQSALVLGDENQLIQVILNLSNNARDAMSDGGVLTIAIHRKEIDTPIMTDDGISLTGLHAVLTVTDTGHGMNEETVQKIFEPFFTTKEVGKGTGLGLSTAYGIVKQHNGTIKVISSPAKGTTVEVYLPLYKSNVSATPADETSGRAQSGTETILIAEDDEVVRELITRVLSEAGYHVIDAADGEEAVAKFSQIAGVVDLVILDVIMAKMNGQQAYDEIRKIDDSVAAMFLTGYSADIVREKGLTGDGLKIVNKPVAPRELLAAVRDVLDHST